MITAKPGTLVTCTYRNHGKWIGQVVAPSTAKAAEHMYSQADYCQASNTTLICYPFGTMADSDDSLEVITEERAAELRAEYWRGGEAI